MKLIEELGLGKEAPVRLAKESRSPLIQGQSGDVDVIGRVGRNSVSEVRRWGLRSDKKDAG